MHNTLAYAKVITNPRLNMLRLLVTFDGSKRNKNGDVIVSANNAAYASGDLCSANANPEYIAKCVQNALNAAQLKLCTNNVAFV